MAKKGSLTDEKSGDLPEEAPQSGIQSAFGNSADTEDDSLDPTNRVASSVDQLIEMGDQDITDAKRLINNAKKIAAKKNGSPPMNGKRLKDQGKGWKSNFSTRFLQKELNRAAPRLYMPILTASTLTAASLPAGWPKAQEKNKFFRDTVTQAFRGWRKHDMYWRGSAQEVVDFGFCFAAWTDKYEWRPHLCRMDRGFVPRGTEIMDDELARFTLKWDYRPDELLKLAKDSIDSGSDVWIKDAVATAVAKAQLPSLNTGDMSNLRKREDLVREQTWDFNYTRGQKMVETRHMFILEFSGKVSHYIVWVDGVGDDKLLYEDLDAYDGTDSAVIPLTFGYGDGTIHGSWGAGQLLYDLAAKVERIRNESVDNMLNSNKVKLQVPDAKSVTTAQLVVNDTTIIATAAQFAQNTGGISANPEGYIALDNKMTQWAQEIVGSYLPPLPNQASRAANDLANQAIENESQIQKDVLENWMKQVALVIGQMTKRMLDEDTNDDYALAVQAKLLGENVNWFKRLLGKIADKFPKLAAVIPPGPIALTKEEIALFVNQPVVQSVTDFTEYAASQRGAFAASVQNNPLFNQQAVARYMAEGVTSAGSAFADSIVVPEGDSSTVTGQQRQQMIESTSMLASSTPLPVIPTDNHFEHWKVLEPQLESAIQGGLVKQASAGLQHLAAHYAAGVAGKTFPPDQINPAKAKLAQLQQALTAKTQEQQQAAQQQQQAAQAQQAQL